MVAIPGAGPDGLIWLLLPRSDYEIVDTWFAAGMRGRAARTSWSRTSSSPRTAPSIRTAPAMVTGRLGASPAPSYRAPLRCLTGWDLAAPLIGIAQGAVDELTSRLRGTTGAGRSAESVPLQMRLAEASAEVDAARMIHQQDIREIIDKAGAARRSPSSIGLAIAGTRPSSVGSASRR